MNIKLLNNNLVVLFDSPVYSSLSLDDLKTIAVATFVDKNPNPIVAQFPELTAITIPEVLISVMLQQASLIVGDQTIGEFQARNNLGLITMVKKLQESIQKPVIAYGYNFICNIENTSFEHLSTTIKNKFFKEDTILPIPSDAVMMFALPNISFTYNGAKISLKFSEVIENPTSEASDFIRLNINVHYNSNQIPDLQSLKTDYESIYSMLDSYINDIFS